MAPNTWVRVFFSEYPKCDILLNNTCEVFNKYILEARELPILTMIQKIKSQLMVRHYNKQKDLAEKWLGMAICPKIRKKLDRHAEFSNTCYPVPSGNGIFEVHDREWHYVVDLFGKHCECRRWQLTGIPCSHAISCLKHERIPENSVLPNCYSIDAFKNAYGCNIFPCSEKSSWENVGGPEVQPPKYEKKVGRPPKARRRAAHEVQGPNGPRLSKYGVIIHCSHCGQAGHNSASCAAKKAGQPAVKKTKRPTVATTAEPDQQPSYENNSQVCAQPQPYILHVQNVIA